MRSVEPDIQRQQCHQRDRDDRQDNESASHASSPTFHQVVTLLASWWRFPCRMTVLDHSIPRDSGTFVTIPHGAGPPSLSRFPI